MKLVWFTEAHIHITEKFNRRILVNVDNITCIVPSGRDNESHIYFNGEESNFVTVTGTVEEAFKTIELA